MGGEGSPPGAEYDPSQDPLQFPDNDEASGGVNAPCPYCGESVNTPGVQKVKTKVNGEPRVVHADCYEETIMPGHPETEACYQGQCYDCDRELANHPDNENGDPHA